MKSNADKTNTSSGGIQAISQHEDRKYDTIPFRLDFIKDLLKDGSLETVVDFDNIETETFTHPNGHLKQDNISNGNLFEDGNKTVEDNDIRNILNKKKYNFSKIIMELGGKLRYIKSGTTGHTFKGSIIVDNSSCINYGVKVVAYPKKARYGDMNDINRPENAELMMIRLLSYFVVKKQTPHIALPISFFNTSILHFTKLIEENYVDKDNKKYKEFVERYKKGEYYDTVSILLSEWANRGDLLDFIKKNYKEFTTLHWKVIFFQILSVLAVIQSKFPSFRHNDAKVNNILIHKIAQRGTIFSYSVCRKKYYVPSIGYLIKLWDFDFSCIPGVVENTKVSASWTDEINVKPVQNRYYDMHYFFNTLIRKGFFPELMTDPSISREIKDFVNRVVPPKYQYGSNVAERGRILVDDEYLTPNQVLRTDPFFEEFRNYKPKKIISLSSPQTSDNIRKKYVLNTDNTK